MLLINLDVVSLYVNSSFMFLAMLNDVFINSNEGMNIVLFFSKRNFESFHSIFLKVLVKKIT